MLECLALGTGVISGVPNEREGVAQGDMVLGLGLLAEVCFNQSGEV